MANLKRPKNWVAGISSSIIILSTAMIYGPMDEVIVKKWDKDSILVWEDFVGPIPIFTTYGAAISSKLYYEYDSTKGRYHVYAGQNNQRSWVKKDTPEDSTVIIHEQYHFNITEIFARRANQRIDSFPDMSEEEVQALLDSYIDPRQDMQYLYDAETDHNLIDDAQFYWEYKIDNELLELEGNKNIITDRYSGISAEFPSIPDIGIYLDTFLIYRYNELIKYGVLFNYMSLYDYYLDSSIAHKEIQNVVKDNHGIDLEISNYNWLQHDMYEYEFIDTAENVHKMYRWLYKEPYQYYIMFFVPVDYMEDPRFMNMRYNFFNSIEIQPQDDYWIGVYERLGKQTVETSLTDKEADERREQGLGVRTVTYQMEYSDYTLEYHRPINHDKKVLIPYRIHKKNIDEIEACIAIINDKMFEQAIDSTDQIFAFDKDAFQKGENRINFGYILKEDTIKEKFTLYGTEVIYEHY